MHPFRFLVDLSYRMGLDWNVCSLSNGLRNVRTILVPLPALVLLYVFIRHLDICYSIRVVEKAKQCPFGTAYR